MPLLDRADLSEAELNRLFEYIKYNHPRVLDEALTYLKNAGGDGGDDQAVETENGDGENEQVVETDNGDREFERVTEADSDDGEDKRVVDLENGSDAETPPVDIVPEETHPGVLAETLPNPKNAGGDGGDKQTVGVLNEDREIEDVAEVDNGNGEFDPVMEAKSGDGEDERAVELKNGSDAGTPSVDAVPLIFPVANTRKELEEKEGMREGCYLVYDPPGSRLMLHYSRTPVRGSIGFFWPGPGHKIKGFKFVQNHGRAQLIGNCAAGSAGRLNYCAGWCQFIRAAKALDGTVVLWPPLEGGIEVDLHVYRYSGENQTSKVKEDTPFDMAAVEGVACVPHHADFFEGVSTIDLTRWLDEGNKIGAATSFANLMSPKASKKFGTSSTPQARKPFRVSYGGEKRSISPNPMTRTSIGASSAPEDVAGCYLVYNETGGGRLDIHYSRSDVTKSCGVWHPGPGKKIQGFKLSQNAGRAQLIGNCAAGIAGRKNYYSGWCQFVRAARGMNGSVTLKPFSGNGLEVDVYLFFEKPGDGLQTVKLEDGCPIDVSRIDAVACLPKHAIFVQGFETIDQLHWLNMASTSGAASRFQ